MSAPSCLKPLPDASDCESFAPWSMNENALSEPSSDSREREKAILSPQRHR